MKKLPLEPLVTIIIPTFNRGQSIGACIDSLLRQSYDRIEIIISDDGSTDETTSIVEAVSDERVRLIRSSRNRGPSAARNAAIKQARGSIIFFTDDDVLVPPDWIATGMKYFADNDLEGIEGRIVYVAEGYRPHLSDRIVENRTGGQYMTANAAYRRRALLNNGGFDLSLRKYQDRDLAIRICKTGDIKFAPDVKVYHQRETYTIRTYLFEAEKIQWWVPLFRRYGDSKLVRLRIYDPLKLLVILCPPLIILKVFQSEITTKRDWGLFALLYPRLIYERVNLWRSCLREKTFLI